MILDCAPWQLSGVVYGTLLNHRPALAALGDAVAKPPYQAAPRAPVLYLKPRNTLAAAGDAVVVPAETPDVEVGASLGLVIGRTACRVSAADAAAYIAALVVVNDVTIPHAQFYRPSIRFRARDGFCPLGTVVAAGSASPPYSLTVRVSIDDGPAIETRTADMVRDSATLLEAVTEFMTLSAGDILTLGAMHPAPRARAGQTSRIEISGLPPLVTHYVPEVP